MVPVCLSLSFTDSWFLRSFVLYSCSHFSEMGIKDSEERVSLGTCFDCAFTHPRDIKGTALLSWEQKDREDDQWMYLPDLKKMQRIAGSNKKKYFMGTDFTFVDLESEQIEDYDYKCLQLKKCAKAVCYEIEATPKDKKIQRNTGYKRRVLLIRKSPLITLRVKFFDQRDTLIKTLTNSSWKKYPNGVLRNNKSVMDRHNFHKTIIEVQDRSVNTKIDDATFTERFVTKGMHVRQ